MCQLNVYCFPKSVNKEKVLSLMESVLSYPYAENIDEEKPIEKLSETHSFFISGGMRCDCGSVVSIFQEEDGTLSFSEYSDKLNKEEIEKLVSTKNLMEEKGYKKRRRAFGKQLKKLQKEMDKAYDGARLEEERLTDAVMNDDTLSEQEKSQRMHEQVYPFVEKLLSGVDKDERVVAYNEFVAQKREMFDSFYLTLKRKKKKKAKFIRVEDLALDNGQAENFIEMDEPSFCIYDMIENVKDYRQEKDEFERIKEFVEKAVALEGEVSIFPYWQDGATPQIIGEKKVVLSKFKIEDVAYLKYGEILTIEKDK